MARFLALIAAGMLAAGCGYAPMGRAGALPSDVRTNLCRR